MFRVNMAELGTFTNVRVVEILVLIRFTAHLTYKIIIIVKWKSHGNSEM